MTKLWVIPKSCRNLPIENLGDRFGAANELIQLLRNPNFKAPSNDFREEWTLWIKTNLHSLICTREFYVSPSGPSTTKGEFLTLDMAVEEKEFPKRIVLAVESEIDDTKYRQMRIEQDCEKLLAIKAPFKLMIFSSEKHGFTNEKAVEAFQLYLEPYGQHLQGETYIFVDYNENNLEGINGSFIAHIWQSELNGPQTPITLLPVSSATPPL
jgi:hypothetical protein